ncbi:MAG: hypothetical protein HY664_00195 [Chloroflexi bacterium]|nr:hypothetical protein [Chloroflexota bacterium]
MAEEILLAHGQYISKLTLIPSTGGRYEVTVNGELVYSKAATKVFPELREIMEKVAAKLT